MERKIRICSLFSGIGGFETGFFNAFGKNNCDIVFSSEIDNFSSKGYELLYGHKPFGDIRRIKESEVPDHDILLAGFPCQAFSVAGKRLGLKDTRGTLFFEVARIARVKQPKIILLENVKGLLSDSDGDTIYSMLYILSEMGYKVDITVLNSKYYNVAQNRERVFIVAMKEVQEEEWINDHKNNERLENLRKEVFKNKDLHTFNFNFPDNSEVTKRIKDILEENVPNKYYMKHEVTYRLLNQIKEALVNIELKESDDIHKVLDMPKEIVNDNQRQRRLYSTNGISPTILARPDTPKILLIGYLDMKAGKQIRSVYSTEGLSPTVDTAQGGHRQVKVFIEPEFAIRKITPLEAFRLQGFPDEYYYILRENKISDTQLYKMAGNAVTTNVIEAIANRIKNFYL